MNNEAWTTRRDRKRERLDRAAPMVKGKRVDAEQMTRFLEAVMEPGDTVILEGDNQKQASFLAQALEQTDPDRLHGLHMVIPSVSRPEHSGAGTHPAAPSPHWR